MFHSALLKIKKVPNEKAMESVGVNCTHVEGQYWLMEGAHETLENDGIEYDLVEELVVDSLGDFTPSGLVDYVESISDWKSKWKH